MRILELELVNFQIFEGQKFALDGRDTIIFGVNGTGKSTVLAAVNFLDRVWVNRLNPSQGKAFLSFSDDMVTIRWGEVYTGYVWGFGKKAGISQSEPRDSFGGHRACIDR